MEITEEIYNNLFMKFIGNGLWQKFKKIKNKFKNSYLIYCVGYLIRKELIKSNIKKSQN